MTTINTSIGAALRSKREARGLSQAHVARQAGVTQASISNYERGLRSPSVHVLCLIAGAFDEKPGYFLSQLMGEEVAL